MNSKKKIVSFSAIGMAALALCIALGPTTAQSQLGYIAGVRLQNVTPGTVDTGHFNVSGTGLASRLIATDRVRLVVSGLLHSEFREHFGEGGGAEFYMETGGRHSFIEPDVHGSGGYMQIGSLVFDNMPLSGTTNQGVLSLSGTSNFAVDAGSTGTDSVRMAPDAVDADEMLNEPGVASIGSGTNVALTGTHQVMLSRSMTVPTDGFVIAVGWGIFDNVHTVGTEDVLHTEIALDSVNPVFAANTQIVVFDASLPSGGNHRHEVPYTRTFPVTAGTHTFNFVARENSTPGNCLWVRGRMELIFVPTDYGTVTGDGPGGDDGRDQADETGIGASASGLSADDMKAEKKQELERHVRSLRAQVERSNRQMADLLKRLSKGNGGN